MEIPAGMVQVPAPPADPLQTWNGAAWVFTIPALIKKLSMSRVAIEAAGFTYKGQAFPLDLDSRTNILALNERCKTRPSDETQVVQLIDGSKALITSETVKFLASALSDKMRHIMTVEETVALMVMAGTVTTPQQIWDEFSFLCSAPPSQPADVATDLTAINTAITAIQSKLDGLSVKKITPMSVTSDANGVVTINHAGNTYAKAPVPIALIVATAGETGLPIWIQPSVATNLQTKFTILKSKATLLLSSAMADPVASKTISILLVEPS